MRIVERWAANGEPSLAARLDQVRALLELQLMDRAWVRLKELEDLAPDNVDVQLLTAEMFLRRGWPVRARKLLKRISGHHPDLDGLNARAAEPPAALPANASAIESDGAPPARLALAEQYLAAGSFLKARSLLERLRREGGTWSPRVDDLLWGLSGEFAQEQGSAVELARQVAPAELDESAVDRDPSAAGEITSTGGADPEGGSPGEAFPALFRRVEPLEASNTTEEVTAISRLASRAELEHADPTEEGPDGEPEGVSREADTQIMMVIRQDNGNEGPGHVRKEESGYQLHETLNLREYLDSMGVDPALGRLGADDDVDLEFEEEDEDLIVVTRREPEPELTEEELELHEPVQVVEKPLAPPKPPPTASAPPPAAPQPLPEAGPPSEELVPIGGFNAGPRMILGGVVLLALGAMVVFLGLRFSAKFQADRIQGRALDAIAGADFRELQELELQLEAGVAAGAEPVAAWTASYALVELVLWHEYTGDPTRLEHGEQALVALAAEPGADLALVAAYKSYAQGSVARASDTLALLDVEVEPEAARIGSLIALQQGDLVEARRLADLAVAADDAPRFTLLRAEVCVAAQDLDCAQKSVTAALAKASVPQATLWKLRLDGAGTDATAQLSAVESFLAQDGLPPRIAGNAQAWRSDLLLRLERAEDARAALDDGLNRDPGNRALLLRDAQLDALAGQQRAALKSLNEALTAYPGDMELRAARLRVLLDLDRIEQCDTALNELTELQRASELGRVLQAEVALLGMDDPQGALELLDGVELAQADYLRGRALGEQALAQAVSDPATAQSLRTHAVDHLQAAAAGLESAQDPWLRAVRARSLAAAARFAPADQAHALAETAEREAPHDPVVLIQIGMWKDELKDPGARVYFDRAVELNPDSAVAHFARGRFYKDFGDRRETTRMSWRAYMDLSPSGPRADKVMGDVR